MNLNWDLKELIDCLACAGTRIPELGLTRLQYGVRARDRTTSNNVPSCLTTTNRNKNTYPHLINQPSEHTVSPIPPLKLSPET